MALKRLVISTNGEKFYNITKDIRDIVKDQKINEGIIHLFCMHTSCGLTINESFDPSAREDLEQYLKYIAPRNLDFIKHDSEGPDDSPSHMKTMLTAQQLAIPLEEGELTIGTWQGIYLCEFRDSPKKRTIVIKIIES